MGSVSLKWFRLTSNARPKIADAFSGQGGLYTSGRWHSRGLPIVYASESISLAYLETLAHFASEEAVMELLLFEVDIPDSLIESLDHPPKGWDVRPPNPVSQRLGDEWLKNKKAVALKVPSVIVSAEKNVLINPLHPDFDLGWVRKLGPFPTDPRLKKRANA